MDLEEAEEFAQAQDELLANTKAILTPIYEHLKSIKYFSDSTITQLQTTMYNGYDLNITNFGHDEDLIKISVRDTTLVCSSYYEDRWSFNYTNHENETLYKTELANPDSIDAMTYFVVQHFREMLESRFIEAKNDLKALNE